MSVLASVRRLTAAGVLAAAVVGAAALPAAAAGQPVARPHQALSADDARHFPRPGDRWGRDHRYDRDHRHDGRRYGHWHDRDGRFGDHDDRRGHRWH
ncbi:hypothetical protein ACF09H_24380 [Streptomyces sp. NPDC014983]|uniref:hypothetical protein n=1 Tax=Streptomyces sp. NPDC014983 TaxID=3364933 RepID=UPI0036FC585F